MNFIANESAQKLRGGYYTPEEIATFLCKWVLEIGPRRVLEPSCGDGVFFSALRNAGARGSLSVVGFELDETEAQKARSRLRQVGLKASEIHASDFLSWALANGGTASAIFDVVIGNPPFVRYQYLPAQFQVCAEKIFRALRLPFTKHTNAWVPFVLASLQMLRPGGRLAMVVPSELIHVMHAQSLRTYLAAQCRRLVIIDPEELWFSETLQGAVILLAEKKSLQTERSEGVGMYSVRNREFLHLPPASVFDSPRPLNGKTLEGKWTRALLNNETRELLSELSEHPRVYRFNDVASVDVGIVTGANKFFLVTNETVNKYELVRWAHPMFGRSEHCPGILYNSAQHIANAKAGYPTNFLWFPDDGPLRYRSARKYIEYGEAQQLHTRFKCRTRSPWFAVPSVYSTQVGMLKRSHDMPRLILNCKGAYTTDTAYRVRALGRTSARQLVGCFINGLTALSAELEGRHYGGGVLELVPSEIEKLALPLSVKNCVDLRTLDREMRTLPAKYVLEKNSRRVLGSIGLHRAKQDVLIEGWRVLRNRRHRIPTVESSPIVDAA